VGNNCRGSMGNCMSSVTKVDMSHTSCIHMHSTLNYSSCRGSYSRGDMGNNSRGGMGSCVSCVAKVDVSHTG